MNTTSIDFPPEVDESEIAGLTKLPCIKVKPPRIAQSPANIECRLASTVEIGNTHIMLGEIIYVHIKKEFLDPYENQTAHTDLISPVGRCTRMMGMLELLICLIYRVYLLNDG